MTSSSDPERKAMLLSERALADLAVTSARRSSEQEAMEEALALLAERDARLDSMARFVNWADSEWGEPTRDERARAHSIIEATK